MSRQFRIDDTSPWAYGFGNGSDGALTISTNTTFNAPIGTAAGTSGAVALTTSVTTFANNDLVLIWQYRGTNNGVWELNKVLSGGGTTSLVMAHPLQTTYANSGANLSWIVKLKQYSSITVDSTKTWSGITYSNQGIIACLCSDATVVNGTIYATSIHQDDVAPQSLTSQGHPGGGTWYLNTWGDAGASYGSAAVSNQRAANGGAGGGGHCEAGGDSRRGGGGGASYGSAGEDGESKPGHEGGYAGGTYGTAELTSLHFGSGGGGGGGDSGSGSTGGAGGGMVLIITRSLSFGASGSIQAGGSKGQNPESAGIGGAGSGGSILIKCQTAALGTTRMTATGGARQSSTSADSGYGGAGGDGRIHIDYLTSVTGTTSPTASTRFDPGLHPPFAPALFFV